MKRLTKDDIENLDRGFLLYMGRMLGKSLMTAIIKEMHEYKSIEDDLGIDFVTLFNALNNGIYYVKTLNNFHKDICFSNKVRYYQGYVDAFDEDTQHWTPHLTTKNYGELWALTKEELQ